MAGRSPVSRDLLAGVTGAGSVRRELPLGIRAFRTLREEGCYYVDRNRWIWRFHEIGSRYFLSRPRRFGKSLLDDTIKERFEGSEELLPACHVQGDAPNPRGTMFDVL